MNPTVVRAADLAAYSPANHTGTSNVRVICPETVGATALEVLVGTIVKSHGAKPHAHPHLEQCAYMIEGTGESQAEGRVEAMGPGTWSYVPAGAFHSFRVTSDQPGRVLVVYAPPYGENPAQTITEPDPAVSAARRSPRAGRRRGHRSRPVPSSTATPSARSGSRSRPCAWPTAARCRAPPRPDAEQVLYLEDGHIDARAGEQDFHLAPGDFLFLPRGAGAALRCPTGRRASGFLIKGRLPSSPSL